MLKTLCRIPAFWLLFSWNIGLALLLVIATYKLMLWTIGFWRCQLCKTRLWANAGKHSVVVPKSGMQMGPFCDECYGIYLETITIKPPPRGGSSIKPPQPRTGA